MAICSVRRQHEWPTNAETVLLIKRSSQFFSRFSSIAENQIPSNTAEIAVAAYRESSPSGDSSSISEWNAAVCGAGEAHLKLRLQFIAFKDSTAYKFFEVAADNLAHFKVFFWR
uniref:Uncharacterized protein n=1 Tax=Ascaris lumbricoides TaxID=6252 RepID=A0A0M3I8H8_ASCLU